MKNCFIILAAGKSERFNSSIPKPYINYKGKPIILHSIDKAVKSKIFDKIILVINKKHKKYLNKNITKNIKVINGGLSRSESSYKAIQYIKKSKIKNVFIHDAARPNFSIKLINKILINLKTNDCVVPALKPIDSVKIKKNKKLSNLNRKNIFLTQTPQAFKLQTLLSIEKNISENITDESTLFILNNKKIKLINGEKENYKITTSKDIKEDFSIYYGLGFDIHRLKKGRKLFLGGVNIPFHSGLDGHSDGDVILHSIIDALLGACKLKDIGYYFSDKNKKIKNIKSSLMLSEIIKKINFKNFHINNIDINLIAENPKVNKIRSKILKNISKMCNISLDQINLKGKTTEKLGLIGKEKAIACEVIASVKYYDW